NSEDGSPYPGPGQQPNCCKWPIVTCCNR
uniref:Conotoxin Cl5.3 n=1 Tax=Californiconus californicus TaxID=1736779 RepID=CX53_CONCL